MEEDKSNCVEVKSKLDVAENMVKFARGCPDL